MHQPRRLYPTVSLTLIWLHFIILTDITSLPQSPANNNVGQQNKAASKLYQSVTNTAETNDSTTDHSTGPPADDPKDPNAAERNKAPLLQELNDALGIKGLLVLTRHHRKPQFFQGGSLLSDQYLCELIEDGNPMRKFAAWTAGQKTTESENSQQAAAQPGKAV
ncbi:hypothetical protein PSTG_10243 [Puccinia striiformis f. sp. tritici PST-78]|uniref:Uncharacterized protein n=1 Tax=Puccinia striiformis f. sp. tritici PST-78 TaxID=1165861 RepID=A0A0L0VAU8_9BASI|nr:hypothetical protein PSTG_10243 [Puccinia striiformis f. sp. tritici PST-78]